MPRSYKGRNEKETERIRRKRETERQRGREKGMLAGLGRRGDEEEREEAEDGLWRV